MIHRRAFLLRGALAATGWLAGARLASATGWHEGTTLPNLADFGLQGSLPQLKGKVVYLDFWASWCAPCKMSFPVLNGFQARFGPKGFTVLGVNVDESPAEMRDFLSATPAKFPIVRDAAQKLVAAADAKGMPSSFLFDRAGVIRLEHQGFRARDEAMLAARITTLLT